MKSNKTEEYKIDDIISNVLKVPGIKVDRAEFLKTTFVHEDVDIKKIIEVGPVEANCSEKMLAEKAEQIINANTIETASISFGLGIPGGLAMAATIPADLIQFYGKVLKMAQELIYLYGAKDLWNDGMFDNKKVRNQLIMYLGVMLGATGATEAVRLFASHFVKKILEKSTKESLKKKIFTTVAKKIGQAVGVKLVRETTTKGVFKILPVLGGVISGAMTCVSMKNMGKRLADTLYKANFDYSKDDAMEDYKELGKVIESFTD